MFEQRLSCVKDSFLIRKPSVRPGARREPVPRKHVLQVRPLTAPTGVLAKRRGKMIQQDQARKKGKIADR